MTRPLALLAISIAGAAFACARPGPRTVQVAGQEPAAPVIYLEPTIIYRTASYPDDSLAARGLGTIAIVVRVAEQPLKVVASALVAVRTTSADRYTERVTDEKGQVQFDSVSVGARQVWVRAIGYGQARFEAPVSPGCRTDIEVYIGVQAMGIAPPPPQPGRAVITTCRPNGAGW